MFHIRSGNCSFRRQRIFHNEKYLFMTRLNQVSNKENWNYAGRSLNRRMKTAKIDEYFEDDEYTCHSWLVWSICWTFYHHPAVHGTFLYKMASSHDYNHGSKSGLLFFHTTTQGFIICDMIKTRVAVFLLITKFSTKVYHEVINPLCRHVE